MINHKNSMKYIAGIFTLAAGLIFFLPAEIYAANSYNSYNLKQNYTVPTTGTTSPQILSLAPSPAVLVEGKRKNAVIVVDLATNILYKYDKKGKPEIAYSVASGKKSTPTSVGVRLVSHVESYPYKTAPPLTNRRKKPSAFGPNVIILTMYDARTGLKWNNSEYIHGTDDPESLGKYSSHGCIRMDNDVIIKLSGQVKRGDVIVMKR